MRHWWCCALLALAGCASNDDTTLAGAARSVTIDLDALSKDLKRRGFRFIGTTICYAFMQAVGMVNDHLVDCYRYDAVTLHS